MHRAGNDLKIKILSEQGLQIMTPQKFIRSHCSVLPLFNSLPSERGKIKARSQFCIKRLQDLNDSFCVYVVQISFDCRVKEELGVRRDQIKMLSAPCSLQHPSKPSVCVRARAMFVTAGKQILEHNEEN